MEDSFDQLNNRGIMDEEEEDQQCGESLFSSSDLSLESEASDFADDASSSASTSSPSSSSDHLDAGPLDQMSTLMEQLPFKRGLSKFYHGKSQSFTSLSNVRCLEDLAKPENPYTKRLKSCKSYGGDLDSHHKSFSPKASSRIISKKASKGSLSSLSSKRNGFLWSKPPIPRQRSATLSNQTALLA